MARTRIHPDVARRFRLPEDLDDDRRLLQKHRRLLLRAPRVDVERKLGKRANAHTGRSLRLIRLGILGPGGPAMAPPRGAEQPARGLAERDHAGAGQRRDIHQMRGPELPRIPGRIAEEETGSGRPSRATSRNMLGVARRNSLVMARHGAPFPRDDDQG